MKVQFNADEAHSMLEAILQDVAGLKLDQHDRAAVRRWLADDMKAASPGIERLTEKINVELEHEHDYSEVSAIKKPDWL